MSDARSDDERDALLHRFLDGDLFAEERAGFDARVVTDPDFARALARAALLHDELAREYTSGSTGRARAARVLRPRRILRTAAAAAAFLAVAAIAWSVVAGTPASAAHTELARIVARAAGDRTYRIHVLADDAGPRRYDPRRRDERESARAGPANTPDGIEGAMLHLRGASSWVLVRRGAHGAESSSGSDGHAAWNVPERGPVRVSSDPTRFRGALPGEQHDLPFVDPRDGLAELEHAYDLELVPARERDGGAHAQLIATRKPGVGRGPKRVELEYDRDTAAVVRMTFERLPQAKGGPRALELVLVDEHTLAADFFTHDSHHTQDREVVLED